MPLKRDSTIVSFVPLVTMEVFLLYDVSSINVLFDSVRFIAFPWLCV
jgi:hypothetical protein